VTRVIKPTEKYLVSGVTDKTYRFINLQAKEFQYRVRAEKDEAYSQWTEYKTIKLDSTNGISLHDYKINATPKMYNMNGMEVKNTRNGGFYIIDDGTHKKKIVKRND